MGFSRRIRYEVEPEAAALASVLAGMGLALAVDPEPDANIEDALLAGSVAGMEHDDWRILGLVVQWLECHRARINADRLIRCVMVHPSLRVRAFWRSRARTWTDDRRWRRLAAQDVPDQDLLRVGTDYQIARRGEDPRFHGTGLRVPVGSLRHRPGDVASAIDLARMHRPFYWRVTMGPGYRADLWALLEQDPSLPTAELARKAYASFATAWQVRRDFQIVAGTLSQSPRPHPGIHPDRIDAVEPSPP